MHKNWDKNWGVRVPDKHVKMSQNPRNLSGRKPRVWFTGDPREIPGKNSELAGGDFRIPEWSPRWRNPAAKGSFDLKCAFGVFLASLPDFINGARRGRFVGSPEVQRWLDT